MHGRVMWRFAGVYASMVLSSCSHLEGLDPDGPPSPSPWDDGNNGRRADGGYDGGRTDGGYDGGRTDGGFDGGYKPPTDAGWTVRDGGTSRLVTTAGTPGYALSSETAYDLQGGLVWQREDPTTYFGCTANLRVAGDACTWSEARAYCDTLVLDGYDDWQLPTTEELASLLVAHAMPTIDLAAFPNAKPAAYWTRNPAGEASSWAVSFRTASSDFYDNTRGLRVRCLR